MRIKQKKKKQTKREKGKVTYYNCRFCPYKCVSLGALSRHMYKRHPHEMYLLRLLKKYDRMLLKLDQIYHPEKYYVAASGKIILRKKTKKIPEMRRKRRGRRK